MSPVSSSATTNQSVSSVFYFGYGAMVNPTSRARRGVKTCSERPAILRDFELSFLLTGAATVNPAVGQEVHGVLMEFQDEKHWKIIQEFETGYDVLTGPVYPYGSQDAIQAHYFQLPLLERIQHALNQEPRKPQERYLKLIASGMEHHGVSQEYVEQNIKSVDFIPTRRALEYLSFPLVTTADTQEDLAVFTWQEYIERSITVDTSTTESSRNPCFLIGDKVVEIVNPDPESPVYSWMKGHAVGKKCCAFVIYQSLYDPDLPVCQEPGDLQDLHYRWAENQLVEFFKQTNVEARIIGKLRKRVDSFTHNTL
jgi:hypothetical protein